MQAAKLGDKIGCVMHHAPGSWVERPHTVEATLVTPEAVRFANDELLPSGRWKLVACAVFQPQDMRIIFNDEARQ